MNSERSEFGFKRQTSERVRYRLERDSARVEFLNLAALIQFVREISPPELALNDNASLTEIAAMASRYEWTLIAVFPGDAHVHELLQSALNTIHELLMTTELNMDDLEPNTAAQIQKAAEFQHLAAQKGFLQNCDARSAEPT